MKKIRNIGLILGLIILMSSNSNAQYYYTSYGYTQNWHLPGYIEYSIQDNYFGYDIAHVQRYTRYGSTNFNVLLHRNGWFVEIRFDRYGNIYRTIRHNNYPLLSHRCTNHCGYHHTYYRAYYPKYHHKHYVHKHRKTVYGNTHNQHHNNYYSNVHVNKKHNKQKKQNHYRSNQQSNRHTQNSVNKRTNTSQQRSNSVIRQPQKSNHQTQNSINNRNNSSRQRSNTVTRRPQQPNRKVEQGRSRESSKVPKVQQNSPQKRYTKHVNKTDRTKVVSRINRRTE